jgi:hypothetical protein
LYVVVLPFLEVWLSIFVRRRSFVFNSGPGLLLIPNDRRPSIPHVLYRLRQFLSLPFGSGQHEKTHKKTTLRGSAAAGLVPRRSRCCCIIPCQMTLFSIPRFIHIIRGRRE